MLKNDTRETATPQLLFGGVVENVAAVATGLLIR